MPIEIHKTFTNYYHESDGTSGYEQIQVSVNPGNAGRSYSLVKLAAETLISDLTQFEPPIENTSDDEIRVEFSGAEILASYLRTDTRSTSVPEEYAIDGYQRPDTALEDNRARQKLLRRLKRKGLDGFQRVRPPVITLSQLGIEERTTSE